MGLKLAGCPLLFSLGRQTVAGVREINGLYTNQCIRAVFYVQVLLLRPRALPGIPQVYLVLRFELSPVLFQQNQRKCLYRRSLLQASAVNSRFPFCRCDYSQVRQRFAARLLARRPRSMRSIKPCAGQAEFSMRRDTVVAVKF